MSSKLQALRGFNDILPDQAPYWRRLQQAVTEAMDVCGYQHIGLPLLEATELFKRSVGEVTDIVEKEMFTFLDRDKTGMSLRPEGTAGCVRAGIQRGLLHNQQQRLWYAGPMFRHERPQAGRYRQFNQVGVEAFGMPGPTIDVEVIGLSARILRSLGLLGTGCGANLTLEINTLGTAQSRAHYREALVAFLQANASELDEDSLRRMHTNPLRVLDSKLPSTQALLQDAPEFAGYLDADSRQHFEDLCEGLDMLGLPYKLNPRLVRGLDYYSRTVFEWTTDQLGAQGTVCAGGRYDGLVRLLGGGEVPAVGFALGMERLILLLQACNVAVDDPAAPQVYICWQGDAVQWPALRLAERLRERGIRVVLNAGGGSFKAQFKRADKSGAEYALILGEEELADAVVQFKPLRSDEPQQAVAWDKLDTILGARL